MIRDSTSGGNTDNSNIPLYMFRCVHLTFWTINVILWYGFEESAHVLSGNVSGAKYRKHSQHLTADAGTSYSLLASTQSRSSLLSHSGWGKKSQADRGGERGGRETFHMQRLQHWFLMGSLDDSTLVPQQYRASCTIYPALCTALCDRTVFFRME